MIWRNCFSRNYLHKNACTILYLAKGGRIGNRIVEVWPEPAKLHQGLRVGGEGGADAQGFRVEGAAPLRRSAAGGQPEKQAVKKHETHV